MVSVKQIAVERFSVTSSKPFDEIIKALEATIGRSDLNAFGNRSKVRWILNT